MRLGQRLAAGGPLGQDGGELSPAGRADRRRVRPGPLPTARPPAPRRQSRRSGRSSRQGSWASCSEGMSSRRRLAMSLRRRSVLAPPGAAIPLGKDPAKAAEAAWRPRRPKGATGVVARQSRLPAKRPARGLAHQEGRRKRRGKPPLGHDLRSLTQFRPHAAEHALPQRRRRLGPRAGRQTGVPAVRVRG